MKKNRMMRLASLLLVLVLMTSSVVGGTFAKYTSEATAISTAAVARWSFSVGGADIATSTTFDVDLFATVSELDAAGKPTGADDAEVKDSKTIIAPGTGGSFTLNLQNTSEVAAKYTVTLSSIVDAGVPLEFSVDGTNWVSATEATNGTTFNVTGEFAVGAAAADCAPIYWRWVFSTGETGDDTDTDLGINGAAPSVTVKVVAEQID